jgi:hypothetical protein
VRLINCIQWCSVFKLRTFSDRSSNLRLLFCKLGNCPCSSHASSTSVVIHEVLATLSNQTSPSGSHFCYYNSLPQYTYCQFISFTSLSNFWDFRFSWWWWFILRSSGLTLWSLNWGNNILQELSTSTFRVQPCTMNVQIKCSSKTSIPTCQTRCYNPDDLNISTLSHFQHRCYKL